MELQAIFSENFLVPETQLLLNQIIAPTTKTVGAGKDFELFHDAMKWVEKQIVTGHGSITLSLDDGTHLIGEPDTFDETNWTYYFLKNTSLTITSASGNKGACFITYSTATIQVFAIVFSVSHTTLLFTNITIDNALGGNAFAGFSGIALAYNSSSISANNADLKNAYYGLTGYSSVISVFGASVIHTCSTGIDLGEGAKLVRPAIGAASLVSCALGVRVAGASIANIATYTLTTNTVDYEVTINQIQFDGSLVTDETAALSFKP